MSHAPSLGTIAIPSTWHAQSAAQFFAPAEPTLEAPQALRPNKPLPRASVVLSRWLLAGRTPAAVLDELLGQLGGAVQGLRVEARAPLACADGVRAESVELSYDLPDGPRTWQLHAVRVDAGVATHLTATAPLAGPERRPELRTLVQSFRP